MAPRRSSFRARATSLIRSPLATIHQGQLHDPIKEKNEAAQQPLDEKHDGVERLQSFSSGGQTQHSASANVTAHGHEVQGLVRSVPSWVHTREDIEDRLIPGLPCFPTPDGAYIAQHNSSPSGQRNPHTYPRHSQDLEEEWVPPWPGATVEDTTSRWKAFRDATAYPHITPNGGRMVTPEWWRENGPDYDRPWLADREDGDSEDGTMKYRHGIRRKGWYQRLELYILRSPIVPMAIRMTVMGFSVIALALAASLHNWSDRLDAEVEDRASPSTDMAIVVDALAIVYLLYITYDEYSGKPLGLRSAQAKMRLIFLDLFFIVFESANLSLAFVTIRNTDCEYDGVKQGKCVSADDDTFQEVLRRQRALASVLTIALIAWLLTFCISITRLVEKITRR